VKFDPADLQNPLWIRLRADFEQRIAEHRLANDADQTPETTAKLRGRIEELKGLLRLADDQPTRESQSFTDEGFPEF
jgi:hypothetical protein